MSTPRPSGFVLWYYEPSVPAAVIAAIIFGGLTIYHAWRLVVTRTWYCIPFVIGGILEVIGYAARADAHSNINSNGPYIIQSLVLLIAPPFFAASIYMILGRIIRGVRAEHLSIIRINWLTKIFVCGDVACFLVQAMGGGLQASSGGQHFALGGHIILTGLCLQILFFLLFVVVASIFHARLRRQQQHQTSRQYNTDIPWERLMFILYTVSVLITVRNVVRAIEYGVGGSGYLMQHEWVIYVFDGLLMAITLGICATWYGIDLRPRVKSIEEGDSLETLNQQTKYPHQQQQPAVAAPRY